MEQVFEVLDDIRRAAADEPSLPPSWAAAMAVAVRIEEQLRGDDADMKAVRVLAAAGETLAVGRHVAVSEVPAGELPCATALGLWFAALKWYGRGVFDGAMGEVLSRANAVLGGESAEARHRTTFS